MLDGVFGLIGAGVDAWSQYEANEQNWENTIALNNIQYQQQQQLMRAQNQATRELYADLYSPAAKRKQLEDAGLSVGLMYGGGGMGGSVSTSGAGGNAPHTATPAVQPLTSQLGLQLAEIRKLNAETENTKQDTENKGVDQEKKELEVKTFMQNFEKRMEEIASNITKNYSQAQKDDANTFLLEQQGIYQEIVNQYEPQLKEIQIKYESGLISLNQSIQSLREQEKQTQIALEKKYEAEASKSRAIAHKTYKEAKWVDALAQASIEESRATTAYTYAREALTMTEKFINEEMHELSKDEKEELINMLREQVTQEKFKTDKQEFTYHFDNVCKAMDTISNWRTAGAREKNAFGNLMKSLSVLLKVAPK